jgi:hypothetical protein
MFHQLTCSSVPHYNHQMKSQIVRHRLYLGVNVAAFVHIEAPWLQGKAEMERGEMRATPDHEQTAVNHPHTAPSLSGEKMQRAIAPPGDDQVRPCSVRLDGPGVRLNPASVDQTRVHRGQTRAQNS